MGISVILPQTISGFYPVVNHSKLHASQYLTGRFQHLVENQDLCVKY